MKTVIIYDQLGEDPIRFYVVDGDHSDLDGVYINDLSTKRALQDKLSDLVFNEDYVNKPALDKFPVQAVKDGAVVIVCGFLP